MRVHVVDPSAYTPPYDHALCAALARAGARVTLVTSRFAYGDVPRAEGYAVDERFYRRTAGGAGLAAALRGAGWRQHVPDMLRYRRAARERRRRALPVADRRSRSTCTCCRAAGRSSSPRTTSCRASRARASSRAQRRLYERVDAVVVHSQHGRERLVGELGDRPGRVHVIPHGAFDHLARAARARPLPAELAARASGPVVLFFGLLRPYKGIDVLLEAWRGIERRRAVGRRHAAHGRSQPLRAPAPAERALRAPLRDRRRGRRRCFRRADLVVLPYREIDQSGVLFTALAFGTPLLLSDVGGFPEVAETGAARARARRRPGGAARRARPACSPTPAARAALRRRRARGRGGRTYSWDADRATRHLDLYGALLRDNAAP